MSTPLFMLLFSMVSTTIFGIGYFNTEFKSKKNSIFFTLLICGLTTIASTLIVCIINVKYVEELEHPIHNVTKWDDGRTIVIYDYNEEIRIETSDKSNIYLAPNDNITIQEIISYNHFDIRRNDLTDIRIRIENKEK